MSKENMHNHIHWFPGHMMKAIKAIEVKLPIIDVAIEVLDARCPLATRSMLLDRLLINKVRIIILNKSDLADSDITKQWVTYFTNHGLAVMVTTALTTKIKPELLTLITALTAPQVAKLKTKGIVNPIIKVLIMGLPNTGKSTFINNLLGRKIAITANTPGVTRGQQWIKLNPLIDLLDSPGILPPKMDDENVALILALIKALPVKHLFLEEIATFALKLLVKYYCQRLEQHYQLNFVGDINNESLATYFDTLAQKYHFKLANNVSNIHRAMTLLINDLQTGKLGKVSLEIPPVGEEKNE